MPEQAVALDWREHAGLASLVLLSYATAFFVRPLTNEGFWKSAWWVRMPHSTTRLVLAAQACAAVGAVYWYASVLGMLTSHRHLPRRTNALVTTFLVASTLWAPLARLAFARVDSVLVAVLACVPLWVASACAMVAVAFTFEARLEAGQTAAILALANVVVLVDGVGWAGALIYSRLY